MQFPNGVTKSNLIKLGLVGAAMYMYNNRKKPQARIESDSSAATPATSASDTATTDNSKPSSPFTMGKQLAEKLLGKRA